MFPVFESKTSKRELVRSVKGVWAINSSGNSKYNNTSTNAEIVEQGIAVQTMVNEHPVEIEILVSAMMLPSLNNMGSNILIAQVA